MSVAMHPAQVANIGLKCSMAHWFMNSQRVLNIDPMAAAPEVMVEMIARQPSSMRPIVGSDDNPELLLREMSSHRWELHPPVKGRRMFHHGTKCSIQVNGATWALSVGNPGSTPTFVLKLSS